MNTDQSVKFSGYVFFCCGIWFSQFGAILFLGGLNPTIAEAFESQTLDTMSLPIHGFWGRLTMLLVALWLVVIGAKLLKRRLWAVRAALFTSIGVAGVLFLPLVTTRRLLLVTRSFRPSLFQQVMRFFQEICSALLWMALLVLFTWVVHVFLQPTFRRLAPSLPTGPAQDPEEPGWLFSVRKMAWRGGRFASSHYRELRLALVCTAWGGLFVSAFRILKYVVFFSYFEVRAAPFGAMLLFSLEEALLAAAVLPPYQWTNRGIFFSVRLALLAGAGCLLLKSCHFAVTDQLNFFGQAVTLARSAWYVVAAGLLPYSLWLWSGRQEAGLAAGARADQA